MFDFGCFGLNVVAGDQYIELLPPSRMFRAEFANPGLAPPVAGSMIGSGRSSVCTPLASCSLQI